MTDWKGALVDVAHVDLLTDCLEGFLTRPLPLRADTLDTIMTGLADWAQALGPELGSDMGLPFLKTWWRPQQLRSVLRHEFGAEAEWGPLGGASVSGERGWAAVGTVLHWPAANVPIQPLLSLTSGLLSGNRNIVRVPAGLVAFMRKVLACAPPSMAEIFERVLFLAFPSDRRDLADACAERSDAAMVWGGREAVTQVRGLTFPHWARIQVFGPRTSAAMVLLDEPCLAQADELKKLCRRIARETWQFDQEACSSPLVLYVQAAAALPSGADGAAPLARETEDRFLRMLERAFDEEQRAHPRAHLSARLSVDIAKARADWLLEDEEARVMAPEGPAWSILHGGRMNREPRLLQGKTLNVVSTDDLAAVAAGLDGSVQTLGLWIRDPDLERRVARIACHRGVDRVVRLGMMHVFNTPWDGHELVRPLCRRIHFISTPMEGAAHA
jgi:hypothetical protein